MIRLGSAVDRLRHEQVETLPALLHGLAREMRAGRTLHQALRVTSEDRAVAGAELRGAVERIEGGDGVVASIDRWAAGLAHPDADLVRAVLNTGATTGAAMAASLDRAADSLRERVELHREIRALSSQARASALLLSLAPLAFLLVMTAADASILHVVLGSPVGRAAFAAGLVLDAVGWLWMRHMVAGVSR